MSGRNILWILGPRVNDWMGVNRYSKAAIGGLEGAGVDVRVESYSGLARSIGRYVWQYLWLPLKLYTTREEIHTLVVYQESFAYLIIFGRARKKIVVLHHVPSRIGANTLMERVKRNLVLLNVRMVRFADTVVVPTEVVAKSLVGRISVKEVVVIPNLFEPPIQIDKMDEEEWQPACLRLLYVGSEETRKNLEVLFSALSICTTKYQLIKVGKPVVEANRLRLTRKVDELSLNVTFMDFVDDEKLARLYRSCDFYLAPSREEGFGRTIVEAQFHGAPVVASRIPVFEEVLGDTGIFVDQFNDPAAWAAMIDRLPVCSPPSRDEVKANAKRFSILDNQGLLEEVFCG